MRVMCTPGSVGDLGGQPPRSTRPGLRGADHINVLGRYEFAPKESVRQGHLRPLREPDELDDRAA